MRDIGIGHVVTEKLTLGLERALAREVGQTGLVPDKIPRFGAQDAEAAGHGCPLEQAPSLLPAQDSSQPRTA